MRFKVATPEGILVDEAVRKVTVDAQDGRYTFLPRHIDFTTAIDAGICAFVGMAGEEAFLAVDTGILVKQGENVLLAAQRAVRGELGTLADTIVREYSQMDDQERKTRTALARLETDFTKYLIGWSRDRG